MLKHKNKWAGSMCSILVDSLLAFELFKNLLNLNVAACFLKLGECRKSIEACNKVFYIEYFVQKVYYDCCCIQMSQVDIPGSSYSLEFAYWEFMWEYAGFRCKPCPWQSSLSPWNGLHGGWRFWRSKKWFQHGKHESSILICWMFLHLILEFYLQDHLRMCY